MRNNIIFAVFIAIVISALYFISGTKSPQIPANTIHAAVSTEQGCLACHGKGMSNPRKETHPLKDQCFICHKRSKRRPGK